MNRLYRENKKLVIEFDGITYKTDINNMEKVSELLYMIGCAFLFGDIYC